MRRTWSAATPSSNDFLLPRKVFRLSLGPGPFLVHFYLICRKNLKRGAYEMSCAVIGKALGVCVKTVRTHLRTLADAGVLQMERNGHTFTYALYPIQAKACEYDSRMSRNSWMSKKQTWLTGEVRVHSAQ